jgi:hypothetical protein
MTKHTILLIQEQGKITRKYYDYEGVNLAMNGICRLLEKKLKEDYPNRENITYGIKDLNNYIDSLSDLSCLV